MLKDLYITKNKDYSIRFISSEETYPIRQPVLRPGRALEDCVFTDDTLGSTFHLGLFFQDILIGVASYMKNKNDSFAEETQYQLRGMAILKDYQKKGLGEFLLKAGETNLAKSNVNRLWFNARENAVNFYKKHGYETQGTNFNIEGVGIHFLMTKIHRNNN
ncbi:GNAT family N-acetyltransferase [Bizionia argentinensis JUB59]|uniref:GNAT family N-acetyltransferase n=1 Tax=Bizionia argentinensis JUB59 TaxID=1046627 RepID=G2EBS9_9FLAO|nr:GNAT family N-acetyltransferase [Bizionia argentinensis]EGV44084.1 GNAT family N-acetyltransferase [Bizionia argentinensis JUB59]